MKPLRGEIHPCKHEGCDSTASSKGYCRAHYMQFWKYGRTYGEGSPKECSVTNCKRPVANLGLCQRHYLQGPEHKIQGERNREGVCQVQGCDRHAPKDLCRFHSTRAIQYGLSRRELTDLLNVEECPGCGRTGLPMAVHHDHECCDYNGSCGNCVICALCNNCNMAAGLLRDDAKTLRQLADVLERGPYRVSGSD